MEPQESAREEWHDVESLLSHTSAQLQVRSWLELCQAVIFFIQRSQLLAWRLPLSTAKRLHMLASLEVSAHQQAERHRGRPCASPCSRSFVNQGIGCIASNERCSHGLNKVMCLAQLGELLHSKGFSLFEAMSAVEIGDPKLDAGLAMDYSQPVDRYPAHVAALWPCYGRHRSYASLGLFCWLPHCAS